MHSPPNLPEGYTVHWVIQQPTAASGRRLTAATPTLRMAVQARRASGGWLSVGWSSDGTMVPGTAVIGMIDSSGGSSSVEMYTLSGKSVTDVTPIADSLVAGAGTSIEVADGLVTMMFETTRSDAFNLDNPSLPTFCIYGMGDTPSLSMHSLRGAFMLTLGGGDTGSEIAIPGRSYVVLWHGILMFLSWGFLLPYGTAIAAGLRDRFGNPKWYLSHRNMQVAGLLLAILGVCFALGGSNPFSGHGILGMIVMIFGCLQPLNGFLRAKHTDSWRKQWEYLHKGSGWGAIFLSFITIILGCAKMNTQEALNFPGAGSAILTIYLILVVCPVLYIIVRGIWYGGHDANSGPQPLNIFKKADNNATTFTKDAEEKSTAVEVIPGMVVGGSALEIDAHGGGHGVGRMVSRAKARAAAAMAAAKREALHAADAVKSRSGRSPHAKKDSKPPPPPVPPPSDQPPPPPGAPPEEGHV